MLVKDLLSGPCKIYGHVLCTQLDVAHVLSLDMGRFLSSFSIQFRSDERPNDPFIHLLCCVSVTFQPSVSVYLYVV